MIMKEIKLKKTKVIFEEIENKIKSLYNNVSKGIENQRVKFRSKKKRAEKLDKEINDAVKSVEQHINKIKNEKASFNQEDQLSTVESSNKDKVVTKKKKNFKAIVLNKNSNVSNKFVKNKVKDLIKINKTAILKEQEICDLAEEIKEKYQNDLSCKKSKMLKIAEEINSKIKLKKRLTSINTNSSSKNVNKPTVSMNKEDSNCVIY